MVLVGTDHTLNLNNESHYMLKTKAGDIIGGDPLVAPLWPETGQALGLSKNATYDAARAGTIPTVRFGRLLKVPMWFHRRLRDGATNANYAGPDSANGASK
jgi:hypothetical protein